MFWALEFPSKNFSQGDGGDMNLYRASSRFTNAWAALNADRTKYNFHSGAAAHQRQGRPVGSQKEALRGLGKVTLWPKPQVLWLRKKLKFIVFEQPCHRRRNCRHARRERELLQRVESITEYLKYCGIEGQYCGGQGLASQMN